MAWGLQPTSHGVRILCKTLQRLCRLWVAFDVGTNFRPCFVIHVWESADLHGGAIADLQRLGSHAAGFGGGARELSTGLLLSSSHAEVAEETEQLKARRLLNANTRAGG